MQVAFPVEVELSVSESIWTHHPSYAWWWPEGCLWVGPNFSQNRALNFAEHLDCAGGHLAPGGEKKKALKREVEGHSGRIWLTSQRCLGSTVV